ncbi:hypothetical protein BDY21DRAFT_33720 [Lineolata rhizophorae]|uniref:Uncharacterized protein n=1 Tax=Lineolata rhizophorae TaxID=578093 RepID=A0A6A6NZW5_9PEZI|nr:hypothetical protein BDY21DRAFT_33720 [Lineolata rhizophorae]
MAILNNPNCSVFPRSFHSLPITTPNPPPPFPSRSSVRTCGPSRTSAPRQHTHARRENRVHTVARPVALSAQKIQARKKQVPSRQDTRAHPPTLAGQRRKLAREGKPTQQPQRAPRRTRQSRRQRERFADPIHLGAGTCLLSRVIEYSVIDAVRVSSREPAPFSSRWRDLASSRLRAADRRQACQFLAGPRTRQADKHCPHLSAPYLYWLRSFLGSIPASPPAVTLNASAKSRPAQAKLSSKAKGERMRVRRRAKSARQRLG